MRYCSSKNANDGVDSQRRGRTPLRPWRRAHCVMKRGARTTEERGLCEISNEACVRRQGLQAVENRYHSPFQFPFHGTRQNPPRGSQCSLASLDMTSATWRVDLNSRHSPVGIRRFWSRGMQILRAVCHSMSRACRERKTSDVGPPIPFIAVPSALTRSSSETARIESLYVTLK